MGCPQSKPCSDKTNRRLLVVSPAKAQSKLCFDDLPDDMIIEIFSRLPTNKLLSTQTVSRSWSRCVDKTLNRVEVFAFVFSLIGGVSDSGCQHLQEIDLTKTLIFSSYCKQIMFKYHCPLISTSQVDKMLPLLRRCQQIKSLVLDSYCCPYRKSYLEFEDINTLKKLFNALPQLECILLHSPCSNDGFKINKFNDTEWLAFCKEVGPRIKHLTIEGYNEITDIFVKNSNNLEFVYLTLKSEENINYLKSLQNPNSIQMIIKFTYIVFEEEVDAVDVDAAKIISRAKILSTSFGGLQSVARHYPTFANLKRLDVNFHSDDTIKYRVRCPALEHLTFIAEYQHPTSLINHLKDYNLSGLKSLRIDTENNDFVMTALAGKLTSLKKLISLTIYDQWPTYSLLLLKRLVDLDVRHSIEKDWLQLPRVVRLFEVVAEMRWLKRCRIEIGIWPNLLSSVNSIPDDLKQKLIQTQANLRKSLPFVEIDFTLNKWFGRTADENCGSGCQL